MELETPFCLTIEYIKEELARLGLVDMSDVCDWADAMFEDYGNTVEVIKTPQHNMFRLVWTDVENIIDLNGQRQIRPLLSMMASRKEDISLFVRHIRNEHPS